jgi:secreted trypsin-like serine protease
LTSTNSYQNSRGISSRIVGGRQAVPHSHPWQVLLNDRGKFCGGEVLKNYLRIRSFNLLASVLSANWIITAAHCVDGYICIFLLIEKVCS